MAEKHRKKISSETLSGIFAEVKNQIANNNLTLQEVAKSSNVSEELLSIFFDNTNNVVNDLSRLIEFAKVDLYYKKKDFTSYKFGRKKGSIVIVERIIRPICSVRFDYSTNSMHYFRTKEEINDVDKQLIINEFNQFIQSNLK